MVGRPYDLGEPYDISGSADRDARSRRRARITVLRRSGQGGTQEGNTRATLLDVIGELISHRNRVRSVVASGHGASAKTRLRTAATTATFLEAVRETEEVVPVNVSTWVLPSGATVGR